MRTVDLRSDTITHPTGSMRQAMAHAEVGDDVFGEDPTVRKLEESAAERLGKDTALFVASGTMGNLVSLLTHCGRGDEVILGDQSHTFLYEQGGIASLGGIHPRALRNQPDGTMDLSEIEGAIRPENIHFPRSRLIAVENTHNRCAGSPLGVGYMRELRALADRYELKIHVDGARIFNAAASQGVPVRDLAADADSVTFCLSKGLGAPVGSMICGSRDFISEARRYRKVLGGGMRQAGVLAAAGLVALNEMVDRLTEDHANAAKLADGIRDVKGLELDPQGVRTNIVYFGIRENLGTAQALAESLKHEGVLVLPVAPYRLRAVTNYHVSTDDIAYCLEVLRKVLQRMS